VSLIKIYFQPGTDANAAVSNISNLAMGEFAATSARNPASGGAEVRRFESSCVSSYARRSGSRPDTAQDLAQFEVRNQIANVPGASVPQPYGGKYRQIQIMLIRSNLKLTNSR